MGSYGSIIVGQRRVLSFKSHAPHPMFLMFADTDIVTREPSAVSEVLRVEFEELREHLGSERFGRYQNEPARDDESCYVGFATNCASARMTLNARGITYEAVEQWFEHFRASELHHYSLDQLERTEPHPVDFRSYAEALSRAYHTDGLDSLVYFDQSLLSSSPKEYALAPEQLWNEDHVNDSYDVILCIVLRTLLECLDGETEVHLELTDLYQGGYIAVNDVTDIYAHMMDRMMLRINLDYQVYGFLVSDDPNLSQRLRARIQSLDENRFIDYVLIPLLQRMGFATIRKIGSHGAGEMGSDILPFRYVNPLGATEYYALQAKAHDLNARAGSRKNVAAVLDQAALALTATFVDEVDNERKKIDKCIIATNGKITNDARRAFDDRLDSDRRLLLIDIDRVVDLVKQYGLVQYVLFSNIDQRT